MVVDTSRNDSASSSQQRNDEAENDLSNSETVAGSIVDSVSDVNRDNTNIPNRNPWPYTSSLFRFKEKAAKIVFTSAKVVQKVVMSICCQQKYNNMLTNTTKKAAFLYL